MRIRALLLAALLSSAVCTAAAQTPSSTTRPTRDDGIRAFVAGDYAAAARILRPLAEGAAPPDPIAQFFVGFLYYSNLGVPADWFRACDLFQQAAAIPNPFAPTAARMAQALEQTRVRQMSCAQRAKPAPPIPATGADGNAPDVSGMRNSERSNVADAVVAFAHADYSRAVEILKPLTEKSPMPDQIATFFMAMLYDEGLGVQPDAVRACAHYQQAGAPVPGSADHPFRQAWMFVLGAMFPLNQEAMDSCMRMAVFGFDTGFEPAAFQLAPGHSIEWDVNGATVWYQGTSKRFPFGLQPVGGGRFVPIQYTQLETGPRRSDRRHFIEFAFWHRDAQAPQWQLEWFLFEIIRDSVVQVASAEPATSNSDDVPVTGSDELRKYVRLGVNDDGDATWSLTSGADTSARIIDTEADREVDRAERDRSRAGEAAQRAALERAKTAGPRDPNRVPALAYVAADVQACGMVEMAGWAEDRAEAIVVRTLENATVPGTFDLAGNKKITVDVHVFNHVVTGDRFCFLGGPTPRDEEERLWHAKSGRVVVEILQPASTHRTERMAKITVTGAVFVGPNGESIRVQQPLVMIAPLRLFQIEG